MLVAIIVGIVCGFLASLPYLVALNKIPKISATSNFSPSSILLLSVIVSFAILFGSVFACYILFKDLLLIFAISGVSTLIIMVIVIVVLNSVKRKK